MAFLRLKPFIAPKRFVFRDPDTNFEYEEKTQEALVKRIVHYRAQNRLAPLQHLDLVLPNYWCGLPENDGNCELCPLHNKMKRKLWQYIKGGIALVETLAYPDEHIVSQEEAEKRAAKCINCVYNTFPDKDLFVKWSDEIAEAVVGAKKSVHHEKLGNCEVCSCTLKYKIFYKGEMGLDEEQKRKMQEVGCWQPEADKDNQADKKRLEINSRRGLRS